MGVKKGVVSSRHREVALGFVSLWETTGANETIQLPISNLYTIDWGDGNVTTTETSHEYLTAGNHTISSPNQITDFVFDNSGDKLKILEISNWGGYLLRSRSFYGASNLIITAIDDLNNFDNDLRHALRGINTAQIGNLILSPIGRNMGDFLRDNSSFNQELEIDTSNVLAFSRMHYRNFVFDKQTNYDLTSGTTVDSMFLDNFALNTSLGLTNTGGVSNWQFFLSNCTAFNKDVSNLNYSSATNLQRFMDLKTAANYDAAHYDALLIKWDSQLVFSGFVNVNIGMGTIKHTAAGSAARANLVSAGFIITDGGLV